MVSIIFLNQILKNTAHKDIFILINRKFQSLTKRISYIFY